MSNDLRDAAAAKMAAQWDSGHCDRVAADLLAMSRVPFGGPAALKLALCVAAAADNLDLIDLVERIDAIQSGKGGAS